MLRLLVLLGLAALCAAKYDHCCSAADRHVVQEEWDEIWHDVESARLKVGFGRIALLELVEKHPELKEVFKAVDIDHPEGGRFSVYALRILLAFDNIITLLDDPEALDAATDFMAKRWSAKQGITLEHFQEFGQILGKNLAHVADTYDPFAWKTCFRGIFRKIASKLGTANGAH
jgi:hypothetical protein